MRYLINLFLGPLLILLLTAAISAAGSTLQNIDKSGLALQGYDPVSYHNNNPRKGSEDLFIADGEITYRFSTSENQEAFRKNPEKYLPAYGGWCAWAMLDGEKVEVDPETYKIVDGKTLLFYNSFFVNTLNKWNELAGTETESGLTEKAQAHWTRIMN